LAVNAQIALYENKTNAEINFKKNKIMAKFHKAVSAINAGILFMGFNVRKL